MPSARREMASPGTANRTRVFPSIGSVLFGSVNRLDRRLRYRKRYANSADCVARRSGPPIEGPPNPVTAKRPAYRPTSLRHLREYHGTQQGGR
jgi:hypothetical protein